MVGGGGAPLHSWHNGDLRPSLQPSRRFLIQAGQEDYRDLRRSKSARATRSTSDASTSYRPRSARSSSCRSDTTSWTCPTSGRSSSAAYVPKQRLVTERDISKDLKKRTTPDGCERLHGPFGGGVPAGAPSGHGVPKAFRRGDTMVAEIQAMYAREESLNPKYSRGPAIPEDTETRKPNFQKDKVSRKAWHAPPGYGGFTPGVYAENVTGMTYHKNTKDAIMRLKKYRDGVSDPNKEERPTRWIQNSAGRRTAHIGKTGTHSRGCEIPGYGGFVPRSYAGNLVGVCVPRAAKMGWEPGQDGPNPPLIVHRAYCEGNLQA